MSTKVETRMMNQPNTTKVANQQSQLPKLSLAVKLTNFLNLCQIAARTAKG